MTTYLTAKQLGIKEEELSALLEVKEFLKTLRRPKNPDSLEDHSIEEVERKSPALFCMNAPLQPYDCGTGGCIGGWMHIAMKGIKLEPEVAIPVKTAEEADSYVNEKARMNLNPMNPNPLFWLFYPQTTAEYETITPQRAIEEIETFLTTGTATW